MVCLIEFELKNIKEKKRIKNLRKREAIYTNQITTCLFSVHCIESIADVKHLKKHIIKYDEKEREIKLTNKNKKLANQSQRKYYEVNQGYSYDGHI